MRNISVRKSHLIFIGLLWCGWLVLPARAETFLLNDSQTLTGEAVSFSERGVVIKLESGAYAERTAWDKFSQDALKKLALIPRAKVFAEPLIEQPIEDEKEKQAEKIAIVIKTDYPRLERPAPQSFLQALFSSGVGVLAVMLIYAANIYAGYEVSIFRARPPGLVCGVSAALPVLGPLIFLCLPTQVESKVDLVQEPAIEKETYHVAGVMEEAELANAAMGLEPAIPATHTYPRGQFTFNRRFFETKFPGLFTVVKREEDRDMLLSVKTPRGTFVTVRITRVTSKEIHLLVQKRSGTEEVMVPFGEIQEVVWKHKDA
jgi:hypothetical protein